jgi:hypothetical protein
VLRLDVKAVDVVEPTIVGLGNNWQPPRLHSRFPDLPLQNRVAHDTNAVRVRDRNGSLEDAGLLKPRGPGHLAIPVQREPRTEDGIRVRLAARMNDGDARSDGPLANHELPTSGDQCGVTYLHTRYVGDRVERTSGPPDW